MISHVSLSFAPEFPPLGHGTSPPHTDINQPLEDSPGCYPRLVPSASFCPSRFLSFPFSPWYHPAPAQLPGLLTGLTPALSLPCGCVHCQREKAQDVRHSRPFGPALSSVSNPGDGLPVSELCFLSRIGMQGSLCPELSFWPLSS